MIVPTCLATLLLLSTSSIGSTDDESLSVDELMAVIQTNLSKFESLKLQFRTRHREADKDKPFREAAGIWVYRNDGYELLKLKEVSGVMAGREQSHSQTPEDNRSLVEAGVGKRKGATINALLGQWEVHMPGMPRRFFVLPYLLEREEHVRKNYVAEGWESVDGHRCFKFSVFLMRDPKRPQFSRRDRYWLDLERGGHALRWEWWVNGALVLKVSNVRLHPLEGGLWMPVQAREEGHWKRKGRPLSKEAARVPPKFRMKFKDADGNWIDNDPTKDREVHTVVDVTIDPASIKVNLPIENHEIEIDFPTGTQVIDQIEGKQFFQGGVQPRATGTATPPPTEEGLDEVVAKAESQRRTIEATSLARSGWGFWTISLMTVFSALLVVGGILLMQRRGS